MRDHRAPTGYLLRFFNLLNYILFDITDEIDSEPPRSCKRFIEMYICAILLSRQDKLEGAKRR